MHRMKKHEEHEKENSERWLLTYADLITLLLVFFIIMYTMSNVDKQKFAQMANALKGAMGASGEKVLEMFPNQAVVPINNGSAYNSEERQMEGVEKQMEELIEKAGLKDEIQVEVQERGLVVSIKSYILFESGKAQLTPESVGIIAHIAQILSQVSGKQIRIEGHTDSDPISTPEFPSNWELSSARATCVLKLILAKGHFNPTKISAVGYGEYRPKVPNTTVENKGQNRRVDIVIIRDELDTTDPRAFQDQLKSFTQSPTSSSKTSSPSGH